MMTEVVMINPAKAKSLLDATTSKNRGISKDAVKIYADAMSSGKWMSNGEPIIIDDNSNVIDGQHRLMAVVKSGVSQEMLVVRGVDPSAFKTIDSGRKRTHSDVLTVAGFSRTKMLGAVTAGVYTFEALGRFAHSKSPSDSSTIHRNHLYDPVAEAKDRMPLIGESMGVAQKWRKYVPSKVSMSLVGSLHYIFSTIDQYQSNQFFDRIIGIEFGGKHDPIRRLYEACTMRGRCEAMGADCHYAGAIFIKAWNIYRLDSECRILRFGDDETYPKPI